MYKMFAGIALSLVLIGSTPGAAEEVLIPTILPDPPLITMQLTPKGEVVQLIFADGRVVNDPEVDLEDLRGIDLLEIYNLPFDFWLLEPSGSDNDPPACRRPLSDGCQYFAEHNVLYHLNERAQPSRITDLDGKEIPVRWDYLARLDGGKTDIPGYRTFTLIDYQTAEGDFQTRILKPAAIGAITPK
jgi:hypothetical protein